MDDILQFIALESRRTKDGVKTTLIFTPAAIDLIFNRYGVDYEEADQFLSTTIEQNPDLWDHFSEDEKELLMCNIEDQILCEHFLVDEMGVEDFICMEQISNGTGEVKITVYTEEELEYI